MQRPRPKKISSLSPGLFKESIPQLLLKIQDKTYDDPPPCPVCGLEIRTRHDRREHIYATIITEKGFHLLTVWVKRYLCKNCGRPYLSRAPFYPGCLYARPVVDLCLFLAVANTPCRVEAILEELGLQVDRDTVLDYLHRFGRRARRIAGIRIDGASVAVNLVRLLFDAADVEELKSRLPGEVFQDVGDETYPAIKGAKKRLRDENAERVLRGEKERPYPDSHTLACVYEALHKFFASILVTGVAFNTMLAWGLRRPARGCVGPVRDGSRCYGDEEDHIQDVNHRARRLIARDAEYRRLLKEAQSREQIRDYCRLFYGRVREEEAERAAQAYPQLVEDGCFVGVLSTNSMEGGNWRMKSGLRVPYIDPASLEARAVLLAVSDSVRTFAGGRPCESFAHRYGCFEYSSVMTVCERADRYRGPSCAGGGDGGSSGDHAVDHTEEFVLWLNSAVTRTGKQVRPLA